MRLSKNGKRRKKNIFHIIDEGWKSKRYVSTFFSLDLALIEVKSVNLKVAKILFLWLHFFLLLFSLFFQNISICFTLDGCHAKRSSFQIKIFGTAERYTAFTNKIYVTQPNWVWCNCTIATTTIKSLLIQTFSYNAERIRNAFSRFESPLYIGKVYVTKCIEPNNTHKCIFSCFLVGI